MKWIYLSKEFYTCVDDDIYEKISQYLWHICSGRYAITHQITPFSKKKGIKIHEIVLGKVKKPLEIDHINRAPWDNRRCNLRHTQSWENVRNCGIPDNPPFPSAVEKAKAKAHRELLYKKSERRSLAAKKCQAWRKIPVVNEKGELFDSASDAAKFYKKVGSSAISRCCLGKNKKTLGMKWWFSSDAPKEIKKHIPIPR